MVNELNKLIYNSLLEYHAIYLPRVGTLYIKRFPTQEVGRNMIAPTLNVDFSSSAEARSIINIISSHVSVSIEDAEDIYSRWHNKVCDGTTVIIDGVGILRNKSFITDESLLTKLNEHRISSIKLPRKRSVVQGVSIAASLLIIIVIGVFTYINLYGYSLPSFANLAHSGNETNSRVVENATVVNIEAEVSAEESSKVTIEVEPIDVSVLNIDSALDDTQITDKVVPTQPEIGHMVIIGSFQTVENAERYSTDIKNRFTEINCIIRPHGRLYAVVAFISTDKSDCQKFIDYYIDHFPHAWIHTPRELR